MCMCVCMMCHQLCGCSSYRMFFLQWAMKTHRTLHCVSRSDFIYKPCDLKKKPKPLTFFFFLFPLLYPYLSLVFSLSVSLSLSTSATFSIRLSPRAPFTLSLSYILHQSSSAPSLSSSSTSFASPPQPHASQTRQKSDLKGLFFVVVLLSLRTRSTLREHTQATYALTGVQHTRSVQTKYGAMQSERGNKALVKAD